MKIQFAEYPLFRSGLNAAYTADNDESDVGSLLRVEFHWGAGYSDFAPWGKKSHELISEDLLLSKQFLISLQFAKIDSLYRLAQRSMWQNSLRPNSHFTCVDWLEWETQRFVDLMQRGFSKFKLKVGKNEQLESQRLLELAHDVPGAMFRLDFNESCIQPLLWDEALAEANIDVIEDPQPYRAEMWEQLQTRWKVPLACDKNSGTHSWPGCNVLKPAVQSILPKYLLHEVIVTSYMDHPVGQSFAAWVAGIIGQVNSLAKDSGLLTHELLGFVDWLGAIEGPGYPKIEGVGIGFDQLLERQNWQENRVFQNLSHGARHKLECCEIPDYILQQMSRDLDESLLKMI